MSLIRNITPTIVLGGFGGDVGVTVRNPGVDGWAGPGRRSPVVARSAVSHLNDGTGRQYGMLYNPAYTAPRLTTSIL